MEWLLTFEEFFSTLKELDIRASAHRLFVARNLSSFYVGLEEDDKNECRQVCYRCLLLRGHISDPVCFCHKIKIDGEVDKPIEKKKTRMKRGGKVMKMETWLSTMTTKESKNNDASSRKRNRPHSHSLSWKIGLCSDCVCTETERVGMEGESKRSRHTSQCLYKKTSASPCGTHKEEENKAASEFLASLPTTEPPQVHLHASLWLGREHMRVKPEDELLLFFFLFNFCFCSF